MLQKSKEPDTRRLRRYFPGKIYKKKDFYLVKIVIVLKFNCPTFVSTEPKCYQLLHSPGIHTALVILKEPEISTKT